MWAHGLSFAATLTCAALHLEGELTLDASDGGSSLSYLEGLMRWKLWVVSHGKGSLHPKVGGAVPPGR